MKQVILLGTRTLTTPPDLLLDHSLFFPPFGFTDRSLARMSPRKWLSAPVKLFILIMRGTPSILQLIFFYFVPALIFTRRS